MTLRNYRLFVLILAAGYSLYLFKGFGDMADAGWQFRYLTIWALTLSLFSALALYRFSLSPGRPPFVIASLAAVLNALVVLLYWRLFFTDPTLVNGSNSPVWWREYYLHLLGPALQMADALILFGAFRRPRATLVWLFTIFVAYSVWIELFVQPLNSAPVGSVTSGLPYPFLNDMQMSERLGFYATTIVTGLVFLGIGLASEMLRKRVVARRMGAAG